MKRYCPNCKKEVYTEWTSGQIFLLIFLLIIAIVPGIIYMLVRTKKCAICGAPTKKIKPVKQQ